jgi:hypothetical protein
MGFENKSIGTRATATGTLFLAQQGSKIFEAISENVEEAYSQIGQIVVFQMVRNKERVDLTLLPEDQRQAMQDILNMNIEDIPSVFKFRVKTTELQQTEEAKRQAKLTLIQIYSMYGERVFSMLPMIYSPQVPGPIKEVAMKFFLGATEMMADVFKDFGELETNKFLPYTKQIEIMMNAMEQMKQSQVSQMGGGNVRGNQGQVESNPIGGGGVNQPQTGATPVGGAMQPGPEQVQPPNAGP